MNPVSGIPFWHILIYFIVYLCIHVFLGSAKESHKQKLKDEPNNEEIENTYKVLSFAFKWFPAFYVVIIIIMLLL